MTDFVRWQNQSRYNRRANRDDTKKQRGEHLSKFDRAKFLAWDGEGLQKDKHTQVYGLLANSDNDYLINVDGLSTQQCLDFLTSEKYTNNTIHVCFGASYDVNMMLKDVPVEQLKELHKGNRFVRWSNYEMEYRPRKSFTVRRMKVENKGDKQYRVFDRKKKRFVFEKVVTLWDCFGFFQGKFVKVLEEWTKGTEYEQRYLPVIDDIEKGKQKRGNFSESEMESFVLPYCLSECQALKDIMLILCGYLKEAGLKLARWDGAGAVAASALKKYGIKKHLRTGTKLDIEPYPQEVIEAGEYAYFGGWIEAFMFGHIAQKVYHYDLVSAYPSANVDLDSMTEGHWEQIKIGNWLPISQILETLRGLPSCWVAHVSWANGPAYGPAPFSWRNRLGTVTRPVQGIGWQWSPEVLAAYELFPDLDLKIDNIYFFVPDEGATKPFLFMKEIFELRKRLKREKKGVQIVHKLTLNSIYGKLAQSLGYNEERDLKPPYHCLLLAGLITSKTRAKMLQAAMQQPLAIISIATDGIYSLAPLKLDEGENLGQWEMKEHKNMTLVQPGFYWYEDKGEDRHYYRGFNENSITRQKVIDAYRNGTKTIDVETTRFVTLGAAIGLADFSLWRTWRTQKRTLDLYMESSSKRIWVGETFPLDDDIKIARNRIIDPQFFINHPEKLHSTKYKFNWDDTRESGKWDGQALRVIVEEMFTMELSPM